MLFLRKTEDHSGVSYQNEDIAELKKIINAITTTCNKELNRLEVSIYTL
jgi:hypothetical protein